MGIYHQLGWQCDNLIALPELDKYSGAIFSPADYSPEEYLRVASRVSNLHREFEFIFDPQLYMPRSNRARLLQWDYFPNDLETPEISSKAWWNQLNNSIFDCVRNLGFASLCSPVFVTGNLSFNYYEFILDVGEQLRSKISNGFKFYQTIVIDLSQFSDEDYALHLASLITNRGLENVYLIINTDSDTRREIVQSEEIMRVLRFIRYLVDSELNIILGYCSNDLVLWKFAGVQHIATGKFFNLRRFALSRWETSNGGGGGPLPYLFERNYLAYFRDSDFQRLKNNSLITEDTENNPFYQEILDLRSNGENWLSASWKFYHYAMQELEKDLDADSSNPESFLWNVDRHWERLEESRLILDERLNDGRWIRPWLRCLTESNFDL